MTLFLFEVYSTLTQVFSLVLSLFCVCTSTYQKGRTVRPLIEIYLCADTQRQQDILEILKLHGFITVLGFPQPGEHCVK